MNKLYLIIPLALMTIFGFYYAGFNKRYIAEQKAEEARIAQEKAAEEAKQKALEEKAAQEAEQKAKEREAKQKAEEEERRRKQKEADDALRAEYEKFAEEAKQLSVQQGQLEADLQDLRRQKEELQRKSLDLAKNVELLKIQRRNAEKELQRATEMVASRVGASALVQADLYLNPDKGRPKEK